MENESITPAFSREHIGRRPPTTLLILFEIISLAVLARVSSQRRGSKLLFWGLIAVICHDRCYLLFDVQGCSSASSLLKPTRPRLQHGLSACTRQCHSIRW